MPSDIDSTRPPCSSLKDELAAALPEGFNCKVRYIHTPSKRCEPLFSAPPGQEAEITRLASHFLTFSIDNPSSTANGSTNGGAIVYAIEALVYTTKRLTTIFVSKADSTGYLPRQQPSPVKTISTTFLRWLSNKQRQGHPSRKVVISLFARSQSQYLFPGSAENDKKHVLDDRQLVKWWARVLDPLIPLPTSEDSSEFDGYITVPGFEGTELRPFFPPSRASAMYKSHWRAGDPLVELAETRGIPGNAPTRCMLPRFPDDPKARYLHDLDDEAGIAEDASSTTSPSKRKNGRWASVRDLRTFWETMAFRQECSSGRLVGFIWLVMRPKTGGKPTANGEQFASQESTMSAVSGEQISHEPASSANGSGASKPSGRKPLSGPIVTRQPRLKGGSSSLTGSDLNGMTHVDTINGLVLGQERYDRVMQTLMHLDFANLEVAIESTHKWITEVSLTGGIPNDWAWDIQGSARSVIKVEPAANAGGAQQVNDLGGMIRKKRKAENVVSKDHAHIESTGGDKPAVNVLSSGMVRKKPKPTPS